MQVTKSIILDKLIAELKAAGVTVPSGLLHRQEPDGSWSLWLADAEGHAVDIPPTGVPIVTAHDGTPPAPVDYGPDVLDQRDKVVAFIQKIRAYQGLSASAVTQVQRKQYEDLLGDAFATLARRVIGG